MANITDRENEQELANSLANKVVRRINDTGGELLHTEYRATVQNKNFKVMVIVEPVAKEEKSGDSI